MKDSIMPDTCPSDDQQAAHERATRLRASLQRLEERLIENTLRLMDALDDAITAAPLNQRVSALTSFIDRFFKINEHLSKIAPTDQKEQVIRIEYQYPDKSIHSAPPWATADYDYDAPISRGGLWPSLRQNGIGQTDDRGASIARESLLVARPHLYDGEPGVAGSEDDVVEQLRADD
jgi:hypothetical protein